MNHRFMTIGLSRLPVRLQEPVPPFLILGRRGGFFSSLHGQTRKSWRNIISVLLCLQILTVAGCDNQFSVYKNPQYKIKIKYPKTWKVIENKDGAVAIFVSPKETSLDVYNENLSIVVQNLPQSSMPLRQYTKEAINQITKTIRNLEVVGDEEAVLAENPAHRFEYIIKMNFNLKIIHLWTIKNKKAYQLTFGCDVDHCKDYLGTARTMFDSFQLE